MDKSKNLKKKMKKIQMEERIRFMRMEFKIDMLNKMEISMKIKMENKNTMKMLKKER